MLEYGLAFARVRVNLQVCGVKLQIQPVTIILPSTHTPTLFPLRGSRVWRLANMLRLKTFNSQSIGLQIFFKVHAHIEAQLNKMKTDLR